ncbi:PREDICTED: THAP domain-containing protein 3-like [Trachymyrmex cornetzi]|uniref:THAP domain-containing protein 3-like n=1 Tax=Trachymyrmex cornetzi TaxID=471704 RepID=UPI00084F72B0|nr:PREDICTED: THAP domain-containing protein 3-like [Trachymyrmex cornetzi]
MTGCCIQGCRNRSEQGYYMTTFPVDIRRKALWLQHIGKENWKPKPYSSICEVHFDKEMWERLRQDGKKKLKRCAIPTIFPVQHKLLGVAESVGLETKGNDKNNEENINKHITIDSVDDFNNNTFQNNDNNENINTEFINTVKELPENENNNTHISTATLPISNITSSISECALQQIKLLHQQCWSNESIHIVTPLQLDR